MSEAQEDPELIAILPIEASMSGRNSVYNFCEERGQFANYAVCLHTIRRIENNDLPSWIAVECQRAYCHDNCIAKQKKAEEVAAGHALYFVPRPRHITDPVAAKEREANGGAVSSGKYDMSNPSYARGWAMGGCDGYSTEKPARKQSAKPTRAPAPAKKSGFIEEGMADVVNVLMKEHSEKKAEPVVAKQAAPAADQSSNRPLPGESTADFIKRRAAMKLKAGK